jgi:hypothetical protein
VTEDSNDTDCFVENLETKKRVIATDSDNDPCKGEQDFDHSLNVFHTDDIVTF